MKILYIYEKMPSTYQQYLSNLLLLVKESLDVKTLAYSKKKKSDYAIHTYGFQDYFQRFLYKLNLTKYKTLDIKVFYQFDIIHLQHSFLFNKIKPLLSNAKKPKMVITLRGGDTYVKPWTSQSWVNFYNNSEHVDAFITMSEHQKQYLHQNWNVPLSKIHVIPISFGNHSNAQQKYPNTRKLKLVSAFRMTWEKNIEGTVQFAKILKDKNINFQYDIYGDGEDMGQLYYLVDRYDLTQHIAIKGKVDNDVLKSKLVDYDFFVQLSFSEAFPTSVLEAQSLGLPCVVSDSGGLPEAVLKNKTAIVCDYSENEKMVQKCLEIWNDKELYFEYSKNAIEYVNTNFTLRHEQERLTKLYNDLR